MLKSLRSRLLTLTFISFAAGISWGLKLSREREILKTSPAITAEAPLRILAYRGFFSPELLANIAKTHALKVELTEADTPEDLWEKLEKPDAAGRPDLVTLFSYQIPLAAQLGWLQAAERARLANFASISPDFIDVPGDPSLHQVVPLLWGVNGLVLNTKKAPELNSWHDVLHSEELKGKVGLPKSTIELWRLSLLVDALRTPSKKERSPKGSPPPNQPSALGKSLQPWMGYAVFSNNFLNIASLLEPSAAQPDQPYALLASRAETAFPPLNGDDWHFLIPSEKATFWILSLALTRESKQELQAYAFLDAVLEPRNSLAIARSSKQATTNRVLESDTTLNPLMKPSSLRTVPLSGLMLWQDFSRAREVRGLMEAAKVR